MGNGNSRGALCVCVCVSVRPTKPRTGTKAFFIVAVLFFHIDTVVKGYVTRQHLLYNTAIVYNAYYF